MITFILLNLIDAITTYIGLTTGKYDEANLILNNLFEINIYLGLGIKIILDKSELSQASTNFL